MATRHKKTKAERAAIAARMRAYHATRRAAKASTPERRDMVAATTAAQAHLKLEVTGDTTDLSMVLKAVALIVEKGRGY